MDDFGHTLYAFRLNASIIAGLNWAERVVHDRSVQPESVLLGGIGWFPQQAITVDIRRIGEQLPAECLLLRLPAPLPPGGDDEQRQPEQPKATPEGGTVLTDPNKPCGHYSSSPPSSPTSLPISVSSSRTSRARSRIAWRPSTDRSASISRQLLSP